ncbi:hypothetical protein [Cellulomonas sp. C5510]|uniref:hypothetical protein n=1 Tax=Cellulomonas sp. C5510 TaxID=2871170 RepID=UPI001C975FFD|nr:hypothetical protein [Cellulomonas sp. C5510]QZN85886.1 hypothetical protein K5O09_01265 [Cellulomonas sp. C5510]
MRTDEPDPRPLPAGRTTTARAVLPLLAAVALVASGGCAAGATRSETCVDWVSFPTPADAVAEADAVVRTSGPAAASGTAELFGTDATVHTLAVGAVLAGSGARAGDVLEVASTPATCTGGSRYPDGDPLDTAGTLLVLLERDEQTGTWRTLTPAQGVVAAPDDAVPGSWPAGTTGTGDAGRAQG